MVETGSRWHEQKSAEAARSVRDLVEFLWEQSAYQRDRAMASISQFEGRSIRTLWPDAFRKCEEYRGSGYDHLHLNAARSIVQGVTAKLAGRTRPKCSVTASGADWATKRKGKKLERFVEAQMSQTQGRYRDAWAVGLRAFKDACTTIGRGTIKIFADHDSGKVSLERRLPWQVLTDPVEVHDGSPPLSRFERVAYDVDVLCARYPQYRDEIWRARGQGLDGVEAAAHRGSGRGADTVIAYEAWRLPINGKGGQRVICVDGGTVLDRDDWKRAEFPFVDVYWEEESLGDGGTSLCEEVASLNDELNYSYERMRTKQRLGGNLVGSYEEGSIDEALLETNEDAIWLPRKAGSAAPTWTQPGGFSEPDLQWVNLQYRWAYELSGQSYADSTGAPEPGAKSGTAIRLRAAIKSERFSVQANAYELMMSVDIPRHIIACTRELAEENPRFAVRWSGSKFLREIPWSDVDMEDDMYVLQPQTVGSLVNTPEDRVALAETLYNSGMIGKDAFMRVIQFKDVESEMERTNQQNSLVERYIEDWLDATPDSVAEGTTRYRAPIPFMDHASALVQVATAYMAAELDGAPDFNLEFFRRFMEDLDRQIMKVEQRKAALAGNAGTAPITPVAAPAAPPVGMVQ